MPLVRFHTDTDLHRELERYRAQHMPNAEIGDVGLELVRVGLAQMLEHDPEGGLRAAIEAATRREEARWMHERFRGALQEIDAESRKRAGPPEP